MNLQDPEYQERFSQLYRYAQVGRCVSAVTHDVNNLLGAAMAYAELVGLEEHIGDESRRMLGEIVEAMTKCSNLVGSLTAVARKDKDQVNLVDPGAVLRAACMVREYDFRINHVSLEINVQDPIASLMGDPPRLQLALMYLLLNAQETMEDRPKEDRNRRVAASARDDGDGVVFSVWNNGPALDPAQAEAMFAPFQTSRNGFHFGMGLPLVRDIAQHHGGDAGYDPKTGFYMRIPRDNPLGAELG